jgi:hypothetical protein
MTYYLRTFRADPGNTSWGGGGGRTPYPTHAEAAAVYEQCVAMEREARANGERPRDWYLFDIQEIVPEQPVMGGIPVSEDSTWARDARAWARRKMKEWEEKRDMAAMGAAAGEE